MIEKTGPLFTPVCDGCGTELPIQWDFLDAVNAIRAAGWRSIPPGKDDGPQGWLHFCPSCAGGWEFND